jgi:hypothetical protein
VVTPSVFLLEAVKDPFPHHPQYFKMTSGLRCLDGRPTSLQSHQGGAQEKSRRQECEQYNCRIFHSKIPSGAPYAPSRMALLDGSVGERLCQAGRTTNGASMLLRMPLPPLLSKLRTLYKPLHRRKPSPILKLRHFCSLLAVSNRERRSM